MKIHQCIVKQMDFLRDNFCIFFREWTQRGAKNAAVELRNILYLSKLAQSGDGKGGKI